MISSSKFGGSQSSGLHVFAGERLQAFSDAVFAIIATLMVIPLKLSNEEVEAKGIEHYDLEGFMINQWSRYLQYGFSFSLVVDMWYSHVGIFSIIEQVDDVIIWLNLLCLMLISFLPYGIGLVSTYPSLENGGNIAITICSVDLLLIGLTMLLILLYAFRRQSLLHPEVENDANIVSIRRASVISVLITPCLSLLALCFSFLTDVPYISLLLFYSIGTLSFLSRLGVYIYYKRRKKVESLPCHLFNSIGSTIRTEAFSDGVFSIVATLIVLDLTTETILSTEELNKKYGGNLTEALKDQRYVYVAYITSFVVVGLLWFVHYGMVHFLEKLTPALSFINNTTLFLIGGIPFVSGVHTIFSDTPEGISEDNDLNVNRSISIRAFCVLLFLVGVGQLVFWTVALFQKELCLSEKVNKYNSETLQFSKIMVFPVISFIIFWCTFSTKFVEYGLFNYLLFSTPAIFLLLKGVLRRHHKTWGKVKKLHHRLSSLGIKEVNTCVDEKTALINRKPEDDGDVEASTTTTTHMRLIGKGEEVVVEVT